jgi:formylglycine-generating enzyme required for sulfatase activity
MNLTNQHIQNLKSQAAYCSIIPLTPSIPTSRNRLRWNEERDILNKKITHVRTVEFNLKGHHSTDFGVPCTDDMCFNMILCPSGEFMMGAGSGMNPRRREIIKHPFLLGETEVTQELFERVMGFDSSYRKSNKNPAEYCTWYDAVMFCNKLSLMLEKKPYYQISHITHDGYHIKSADVNINLNANGFRLPTEKEWEYAAKAGTNNKYAGCNTYNALKDYAWFDDNSDLKTHEVQTKLPNEWGFYDMSGNVFEWCWDKVESDKRKMFLALGAAMTLLTQLKYQSELRSIFSQETISLLDFASLCQLENIFWF